MQLKSGRLTRRSKLARGERMTRVWAFEMSAVPNGALSQFLLLVSL